MVQGDQPPAGIRSAVLDFGAHGSDFFQLWGHVGLVEGMVARFKAELGEDSQVVATGGLADVIARETEVFDVINMDLTLIGLRLIYEMNKGSDSDQES